MTNAMTQQHLNELQVLLEARRQELQTLLANNAQAARPVTLDQQSVGRVSRVDAIQQQQMALANREQAGQLLQQVERALVRISGDEFGHCQHCGEVIPFARLKAQPYAALCVACQAESET